MKTMTMTTTIMSTTIKSATRTLLAPNGVNFSIGKTTTPAVQYFSTLLSRLPTAQGIKGNDNDSTKTSSHDHRPCTATTAADKYVLNDSDLFTRGSRSYSTLIPRPSSASMPATSSSSMLLMRMADSTNLSWVGKNSFFCCYFSMLTSLTANRFVPVSMSSVVFVAFPHGALSSSSFESNNEFEMEDDDTAAEATVAKASSSISSISLPSFIPSLAVWFLKRTYQPSLLRKKRKCGFLKRQQTVGGRKILERRRAKGRARLFGA